MLIDKLSDFFFNQPDYEKRYKWFFYSIILVILLHLLGTAYNPQMIELFAYVYQDREITSPRFLSFLFSKSSYLTLYYSSILFLILSAIWKNRFTSIIAFIFFFTLQWVNYKITPEYWYYDTHLIFFLFFISVAQLFPSKKTKSFSISFAILYIATLYLQAGLSKLKYGGILWVVTANNFKQFPFIFENSIGIELVKIPLLPFIATLFCLIMELSIWWFIFQRKYRNIVLRILFCFHIGAFFTMRISFWNLILLYPSLLYIRKRDL